MQYDIADHQAVNIVLMTQRHVLTHKNSTSISVMHFKWNGAYHFCNDHIKSAKRQSSRLVKQQQIDVNAD